MQWDGLQKQECSGINPIVRYLAEDVSLAVQSEMAERKRQRMYFVREPSQAQSSDKLDAEITSLIEKATKHREQLDKLDNTFNEARVRTGRLGKILNRCCFVAERSPLYSPFTDNPMPMWRYVKRSG